MFAFVAIPQHLLPGVDGFGLTSYYRPTSPTRHQVWVAPNSLFGLAGLTLVSDEAAGDAEAWRWLLAPDQVVREVAGGHDLLVGVHRLTWLTPDAYTERYGLRWEPTAGGAGALALFELMALDLERLERYAAAAGAPVRRLTDGALLLKPSAHDGFRLVVRQGELAEWVGWRDERLGVEHEVVRMDEFMARGTPGNGEYVLRRATLDDLDAIRRLGREVLPETYGPILPQGYVDMLLERYWSDEANAAAIESSADELLVAESPTTGVLGIAHTAPHGADTVILWRLYLLPRARRLGIGSALLDECVRRCGPDIGTFMTEYIADNRDSASFYAARGFTPIRQERETWSDTEISVVYVARQLHHDV